MSAFFFAAAAHALPGAARRAARPASTPRSPRRACSGMSSGMTELEVDFVMSEPSVPRNKPNFLLRNPLPVTVEHPSFEHFKGAGQCIPSQVYAITTAGFTAYLNTAINTAFARIDDNVTNGQRLREVVAASELTVIAGIQYEDLCDHSGIIFDPPTPSDLFTLKSWTGLFGSREKVRWAVWNPNQQTWLLQVDTRAAWFTMHIFINMKLCDGEVVRLKLSAARASASRDLSIRVAWGDRPDLDDAFVPENTCVLVDPSVAAALFKAASWRKFLITPTARASNVASSPQTTFSSPGGVEAEEETAGEFQRDEELAVTSKVTRKGDVQVMNATIENVSIIDINNVPNFNINFRRCVDVDGEGEVSLRGGQDTPPGVKYINFSLMIPSNIAHHCNLRSIYASKRAHGLDVNERGVSVADFFCVIKSAPKLDTTTLVSHFGLQPAESGATGRVFVFKNAAVQTGPVFATSCTHEEVDVVVDPDVFEANAMCPFSRALQPSYLIVNDAAVRFKIGNMLVNTLLPHLMMNNTVPAMISVAMVTLLGHNYTDIVSGGVSVVNLFPCAWLYSTLANTGKTTALNLGQSCMGTKLIMTSGSTIPHARVRAGQSGGLGVVVLDDYSPEKMTEFAVFIRAVAGEGDEGRVNTMGTYVGNRQTAYAFSVTIYL